MARRLKPRTKPSSGSSLVTPISFTLTPRGQYGNKEISQQLIEGTIDDVRIQDSTLLERYVYIPEMQTVVVDFHTLFYLMFKKAQFDGLLARTGVTIVHVDTHSDMEMHSRAQFTALTFDDALSYMNCSLNEATFLQPLLADGSVTRVIWVDSPGQQTRSAGNPSLAALPELLTRRFTGMAPADIRRHLAWSIDVDGFVRKDIHFVRSPHGYNTVKFVNRDLPQFLGEFGTTIARLRQLGIDSNCHVVATSTPPPTSFFDDHIEYISLAAARRLTPQVLAALQSKPI